MRSKRTSRKLSLGTTSFPVDSVSFHSMSQPGRLCCPASRDSCVYFGFPFPTRIIPTFSFKPLSNVQSGLHPSYFLPPLLLIYPFPTTSHRVSRFLKYHTNHPPFPRFPMAVLTSADGDGRCTSRGPIIVSPLFPSQH